MRRPSLFLLLLAALLTGCGGGSSRTVTITRSQAAPVPAAGTSGPTAASGPARTIDVPGDAPTIAAAVAAATPGSLILLAPGVYHETVEVPTGETDLTIRGTDRNTTILDGQDKLVTGLFFHGDGDVAENLTVEHFVGNGLVFAPDPNAPGADEPAGTPGADPYAAAGASAGGGRPLHGFRASYVTASDNGLYGIYAFAAQDGEFDHLYASGHPDSGVYVGQCQACNVLVTDVVAEHNMVGYEGTNASGVVVTHSVWSRNRVGVALNSQNKERYAPATNVLLTGNTVADNDDRRAPRGSDSFGIGVVLSGAQGSTVAHNTVTGNAGPGIFADRSIDGYDPIGDTIRRNLARGNGTDLALRLASASRAPASLKTCFADNTFASSAPARIEQRLPCPGGAAVPLAHVRLVPSPPDRDYRTVPKPPAQPSMPGARTAPARPAVDLPDPAVVRRLRTHAGG